MIILISNASDVCAQTTQNAVEDSVPKSNPITFSFSPSIGITIESLSKDQDETFTANWLAGLQSKFYLDGTFFQMGASVYAQYGQLHSADAPPVKTQDDLIVSVTPSIPVVPTAGVRLFLEITGETQFTKGRLDSTETNFLDPLFLYQSLFLGKRFSHQSEDGSTTFDLTAGLGYAFQQTITNQFVLEQNRKFVITENSPLSKVQDQVTLESGYSAIIDLNFQKTISTDASYTIGFKTVALTKDGFGGNLAAARVSSLLITGYQYKFLSLDYNGRLLYDPNLSKRRQLDQSLVFGLKVNL